MGTINIDGRDCPAAPAQNLLQACLSNGIDLPYFCWHPALGSVGACRQCAVRQYSGPDDKTGRIVMACMTPAAEGTRISVDDPEAAAFRGHVIEWLMTNHPHDCPVCEEGGECHLQDMTVMTGHTYRRYRFSKRTHRNQQLGPFVKHEMNRCIACYRCVRFYRDYAGGTDLDVFASHNNVYFGRAEDGVLENPFSGNLVEVCPTGVFTDKTLSSAYNRKWDLRGAPAVCVHCAVGCNITVSERAGKVRRVLNRYNGEVNGYFLCDRGRFGYGFTNRDDRIRTPLARDASGALQPIDAAAALDTIAAWRAAGAAMIGIGSPRASLEANFALLSLVGQTGFYAGVSEADAACLGASLASLRGGAVRTPTLREIESADAVLVLGEDVAGTAPRLGLAIRQAVRGQAAELAAATKIPAWQDAAVREIGQDAQHPLFVLTPGPTTLDDVATATCRLVPDDIVRLAIAVRNHLAGGAAVPLAGPLAALATRIAEALATARRPLVVTGAGCGSPALIEAGAALAAALTTDERTPGLVCAAPACNSVGLAMLTGRSIDAAIRAARDAMVIVLEADLYRLAERSAVDALFATAARVVVLDHLPGPTVAKADLVLPAATFAESEGTLVSAEGRAQRGFAAVHPTDGVRPGWVWLRDIAGLAAWKTPDDVRRALVQAVPALAGIEAAAPADSFRIAGSRIRSEPHRYSGRTAIDADRTIHEPRAASSEASPFGRTMEGYYGPMPAALIPFVWAPGWNSVQALNKFQEEVGGALRGGDPGVRLLEPAGGAAAEPGLPPAFRHEPDRWLVLPRHPVFGGDELGRLAPAIAERAAPPAVALGPADARRLGVAPGDTVEIDFDGTAVALVVTLVPDLPEGVAMVDAVLPRVPAFALPGRYGLRPLLAEAVS